MNEVGKFLVLAGLVLVVLGLLLGTGILRPGQLPGDLVWRRGNVTVFFPFTTMLILSIICSLLLMYLNRR